MDRSTFFKHLRRTRLLSQQQLDEVAEQLNGRPARDLARALVEQGLLTDFQAKQLLAGKTKGLLIGPYRILDRLGQGGTSRVFKAYSTSKKCIVTLKLLPADVLQREVQAAIRLEHPNIVIAYDAGEAKGIHFLVQEYIQGFNLDEMVKQDGPLPVELACELMRQTAEALRYAHDKGMVHRDIKPANLLITQLAPAGGPNQAALSSADTGVKPLVKVLDFGLARLHSTETAGSAGALSVDAGTFLGTPDYISPEHAHDIHSVDIRSDLYSLGCAFYYTLTGQVPFPGTSVLEKLSKHLLKEPEPVEDLRAEIPAEVAAIVRRLMAKDPAQRFQTPAELVAALASHCGATSQEADATATHKAITELTEAASVPTPEPAGEPAAEAPLLAWSALPSLGAATGVDAELRKRLREWTAVVRLFARGRAARLRIKPEAYEELHERLVEACRSQAGATEPESWRFFWKLGEMVRPWISVESLSGANREVLQELLACCEKALRECEGESWQLAPGGRALPILLMLGVVLAGWLVNRFVYPFWEEMDAWMNEVWSTLTHSLDLQWWLIGGVVLALLLMLVVSRTTRT